MFEKYCLHDAEKSLLVKNTFKGIHSIDIVQFSYYWERRLGKVRFIDINAVRNG